MPDFTPDRIVKIEWFDAWKAWEGTYEPYEFEHECNPFPTVDIGAVLWENETGIMISSMWTCKRDGSFNKSRTTAFVPRGMIVKVTELVPKESSE